MDKDMELELKNELAELKRLDLSVTEYCNSHGFSSEIHFALKLSLEEVVANVISYSYNDDLEHRIIVKLDQSDGSILVHVEDDGAAFNPLAQEPPDIEAPIEDRPIGGLGIHLVRHYMDSLEYERRAGRNILVMKKSIN